MPNSRFYDNLAGFSDLKYEAGNLYGRLNGGSYVLIPTRGADGQDGADGADGTSAYVYHAFASDSSGTGFTLIDDGTLAWTSWITTNTPIANPSLADFTVWVRRKGLDGTNGANGTDGASAYVYVAWASDSSGTGFSLTPSASLPYRAELHTSTPIVSPTLADFSGVPFVNISGGGSSPVPVRQNSTAYAAGDRVLYPGLAGVVLECSTAGTSAAAIPSLPASYTTGYTTLTDGTVEWTICDVANALQKPNGISQYHIPVVNSLRLLQDSGIDYRDLGILKRNTSYSTNWRVVYPGANNWRFGCILKCVSSGTTASVLPSLPNPITSGVTTMTDGTVTWLVYDIIKPPVDASKADANLSNLTAHTAIDTNCPVDYVIYRGTGTNTWYRIWKSGWVEQGGQCKGTNASGHTTTTVSFPVAFADTKYCIFKNYSHNSTSSSPVAAHVSFYDKKTTWAKTYNYGTSEKDWYACGQGDSTDIAALLA